MLKEILKSLEEDKYKELMAAFNDLRSMLITLPNNRFIAVHSIVDPRWKVLDKTDYFIYGELS